jgi:hypothetical protein
VRFDAEIRYDADPQRTFEMLTDPAFLERVCLDNGAVEHSVSVEPAADGGVVITTVRVLPTKDVPPVVKGFVGETLTVTETDAWGPADAEGSRTGTVSLDIQGAPVKLIGTLAFAGLVGGGSQETLSGELKAGIPLFGGQVEKAAEPAVRSAVKVKQRTAAAWLAA